MYITNHLSKCIEFQNQMTLPPMARPANYSRLSGFLRSGSKLFCESGVVTTLSTVSNVHKNVKYLV